MVNEIKKLKEKLAAQKAELKHQRELETSVIQTAEEIKNLQKVEEKAQNDKILQEKDQLKKKTFFESTAYFKCKKCGEEVPVTCARESRDPSHSRPYILLEGVCTNKACENKVEYSRNEVLKHPVMFMDVYDQVSTIKKLEYNY